jgi:hypothetical protein
LIRRIILLFVVVDVDVFDSDVFGDDGDDDWNHHWYRVDSCDVDFDYDYHFVCHLYYYNLIVVYNCRHQFLYNYWIDFVVVLLDKNKENF